MIYLNYGGTMPVAAPGPAPHSGASAAQNPVTKLWGGHWAALAVPPVGYGSYYLNNSSCLTNSAPGYNGGSTGFYPGGSCGPRPKTFRKPPLATGTTSTKAIMAAYVWACSTPTPGKLDRRTGFRFRHRWRRRHQRHRQHVLDQLPLLLALDSNHSTIWRAPYPGAFFLLGSFLLARSSITSRLSYTRF